MARSALLIAAFTALSTAVAAPLEFPKPMILAGALALYKTDPALVRHTDGQKSCVIPEPRSTNIKDFSSAVGPEPTFTDVFNIVTQRDNLLDATVMAMTWIDPTWPLARIAVPCDQTQTPRTSPSIILTPKSCGDFVTTITKDQLPENDRGQKYWWPSAIEQAFHNYGVERENRDNFLGHPEDTGNLPDVYLQMLTGYATTVLDHNDGDDANAVADKWAEVAAKGSSSPVVVMTKHDAGGRSGGRLRPNEAYVVRKGKYDGNVSFFSPKGNRPGDSTYYNNIRDAIAFLDQMIFLTNGERGPGQNK